MPCDVITFLSKRGIPDGWKAMPVQTPLATEPNIANWAMSLEIWIENNFTGAWFGVVFLDDADCLIQYELEADADLLRAECSKFPRHCIQFVGGTTAPPTNSA